MSGIDEDKKIKKIADLLEKGGTMLAEHHECGAPMFRYRGKILCPVCEVKAENTHLIENKVNKPEIHEPDKSIDLDVSISQKISSSIEMKMYNLSIDLQNETDLQRLKDKMACIEQGIKILKLLKD